MTVFARAVLGALAGGLGGLATSAAFFFFVELYCIGAAVRPWDRNECDHGPDPAYYALVPTVPLVGLFATALLHVLLLALGGQARPWSVVLPGTLLVIAVQVGGLSWRQLAHHPVTATVFAGAFAVAGVTTGFGPWREILRVELR